MKTAEETKKEIIDRVLSREYGSWESIANDAYDEGYVQGQSASHPPDAPVSGEELKQYKKPFRIGRKTKRAILDADGIQIGVFSPSNEHTAQAFCDFLNNSKDYMSATQPTREQGGEKEKFAIRFSEWLMIQCEYKNHCVWEYQGEEYTQNELIEIFKRTTPLPSPPKH